MSDGKTGDVRRDYGGTIKRLYEKIPKSDRTDRFYRKIADCGSKFCTNAYIGKGKIRERFQFAFKLFGISNWETIRPNALRSVFITKLANDPSINIEETMAAARHNSVAASAVYHERSLMSEGNRINCLLPSEKNRSEAKESKVSEVKMAMKTEGHKQFSPLDYKTPSDDLHKANQYPQVTPSVITTTSYSSFSPINCISHGAEV